MAAKFVLGRQATTRDVHAMGKEIAKQIADYTRSRGAAGAPARNDRPLARDRPPGRCREAPRLAVLAREAERA